MTKAGDSTEAKTHVPGQAAQPDRAERLREALRQNLRRRKAQARGRVEDAAEGDETRRAEDEKDEQGTE